MQISIKTLAIAGIVVACSIFYLSQRVEGLKEDLHAVKEVADEQAKSIDQLKEDFKNIKILDEKRSSNRLNTETSNAKMRKDAKKSNVVAAKPRLVEKQINESFNSFARDLQESTR
ncbi:hypothetical protein SEA1_gp0217 [Salmonella phage SEA1]|nr:hypothetical protein SEA1_gp0217 [Salmonella phage SEA1]